MKIVYGPHYKASEKNIKRHLPEQKTLGLIKSHIKICNNYIDFESSQ